jgi:hypothetical protein
MDRASSSPLLGLARSEACHAAGVAAGAVGSYPAFSPLPKAARTIGSRSPRRYVFCGALCPREAPFGASRSPGVTRRCALVSPDFPPRRPRPKPEAGATAARPALMKSCRTGVRQLFILRFRSRETAFIVTLPTRPWRSPCRPPRPPRRSPPPRPPRSSPRGRRGSRTLCRRRSVRTAPRPPGNTGRGSNRGRR